MIVLVVVWTCVFWFLACVRTWAPVLIWMTELIVLMIPCLILSIPQTGTTCWWLSNLAIGVLFSLFVQCLGSFPVSSTILIIAYCSVWENVCSNAKNVESRVFLDFEKILKNVRIVSGHLITLPLVLSYQKSVLASHQHEASCSEMNYFDRNSIDIHSNGWEWITLQEPGIEL